jgi:hypothetical protein
VLDAAPASERAMLSRELLHAWMNGMIEVYAEQPQFRVEPGEKPRASACRAAPRRRRADADQPAARGDQLRREPAQVDHAAGRHAHPRSSSPREMQMPRETIDRALDALAMVAMIEGLLARDTGVSPVRESSHGRDARVTVHRLGPRLRL